MRRVEGLDEEQLQLGSSDRFWTLINQRRSEKTLSRLELERKVGLEANRQAEGASPTE
jgi:hypothetical protein